MEAIKSHKPQTNINEICRFVSLVSSFRRFILKFASVIQIIIDLTRNTEEFHWGLRQREAFDKLKQFINYVT